MAIVTNVGAGCGGRGSVGRVVVFAGRALVRERARAVQTTGAYNHAMASNYNRFLRPAVVLVANGQADLIVERETLEDLIRHERIPARLHADYALTR